MKKILFLFAIIFVIASCTKQDFGLVQSEYNATPFEKEVVGRSVTSQTEITLMLDSARTLNNKLTLDVLAISNEPSSEIFGINFRLFYPSGNFTNVFTIKNFEGGYGLTSLGQPTVATGNALSKIICGFDSAIRYVNGAVQLNNKDTTPIILNTEYGTKLFEIELTATNSNFDATCIPIVLDKMLNPDYGGFLAGSDGLTITILTNGGQYETKATTEKCVQWNWDYTGAGIKGRYPQGIVLPCN